MSEGEIPVKSYKYKDNDPNYKGEPANAELQNGPLNSRYCCTDIFCSVLFIFYICGMVAVAIYAFQGGEPWRLAAPVDSDLNACGIEDDGMGDYPYLYYINPVMDTDLTVCVRECPSWSDSEDKPTELDCNPNSWVDSCEETPYDELLSINADYDWSNWEEGVFDFEVSVEDTPTFIYNCTTYWDRFCMPYDVVAMAASYDALLTAIDMSSFEEYLSDVIYAWAIILGSAGIALVLGFIYLFVLKYVAGCIIWGCIILIELILVLAGYFCYYLYTYYKDIIDEYEANDIDYSESSEYDYMNIFKWSAVVVWTLAFLYFVLMLCMYHKIKFAIQVIKCAAHWIKDNFLVVLIPPIMGIITIAFWVLWTVITVFLWSVGDWDVKRTGVPFAEPQWSDTTRGFIYYQFFGGLWVNAFLICFTQFVLASSCCIWYFSQGPKEEGFHPRWPIYTSIKRGLITHFGSIAFGALLLAIIQAIRIILAYVHEQRQMKDKPGIKDNKFLNILMGCLQCLLKCFERFIRFLNRTAFIQIALTGKSFCPAARDGFFLILRNPFKFGLVHGFSEIFSFLGKVTVTIGSTVIGAIIIIYAPYYSDNLYSPLMPIVLILLITYAISFIFMSIYSIGSDAIVQCYLLDEEIQRDNHGKPPVHCPEELKDFFSNK